LVHGGRCPDCSRGNIYAQKEPNALVRIVGHAPLAATVHELERLRCNACGQVFTAAEPKGVGPQKYDEAASAMIAQPKFGSGIPFYQLEILEDKLGIPLPAATQWEIVEEAAETIKPAHEEELIRQAAQAKCCTTTIRACGRCAWSASPPTSARALFTSGVVSTRGVATSRCTLYRAPAYARVSANDQQTLSMRNRALREYAARRGLTIALQIREVNSGATKREAREKLLEAARRREIDVVLVWRLDRWGRSVTDLLATLQELEQRGVGFVSLTEALDLTTPAGRALAGLLAVFAEFEREILRERTRAGSAHAREKLETVGSASDRGCPRGGNPETASRRNQQIGDRTSATDWKDFRPPRFEQSCAWLSNSRA
jgi:DNA invertase Pin-like site-specific DNA recombinase/transposase